MQSNRPFWIMIFVSIFIVGLMIGIVVSGHQNEKSENRATEIIIVTATFPPITVTPPPSPSPFPTRPPINFDILPTVSMECNGVHRTCGPMESCELAYACYYEGRLRLDGNGNGIPCETICGNREVRYAPRGYPIIRPPR